jgi:hypothetical protein
VTRAATIGAMTTRGMMPLHVMLLGVMMRMMRVDMPSVVMRGSCRRWSGNRNNSHGAQCKCRVAKRTVKHFRKIHPDSPS